MIFHHEMVVIESGLAEGAIALRAVEKRSEASASGSGERRA